MLNAYAIKDTPLCVVLVNLILNYHLHIIHANCTVVDLSAWKSKLESDTTDAVDNVSDNDNDLHGNDSLVSTAQCSGKCLQLYVYKQYYYSMFVF